MKQLEGIISRAPDQATRKQKRLLPDGSPDVEIKFNMNMASREQTLSRDSTTALDFKVTQMAQPTWQKLHELQIHDQDDLMTPYISNLATLRPGSRNKEFKEPTMVQRIEQLEKEMKILLSRVNQLENQKSTKGETRWKTDRKFFNSLTVQRKQAEVSILKEIQRRSQARLASVESDIDNASDDVDENRRDESPSNVKEIKTKANALPHHEVAEREARLVKTIVSQAVSPNVQKQGGPSGR